MSAEVNNTKNVKGVLTSLKDVLGGQEQRTQSALLLEQRDSQGPGLYRTLTNMRVQKMKEVFIDKISRSNIYISPTRFRILSQQEKDSMRVLKCQGFTINEYILSFIYLFDIIFTLVTFVLGSWLSFIDDFEDGGDNESAAVIVLLILAVVFTCLKIAVELLGVTIEDGILLTYITDIFWNSVFTVAMAVDVAMVVLILVSLATGNDVRGVGIAIFVVSLVKIFTLYENLRVIETTFVNSFKKEQYWNLIKVALFNIFFAHFLASLLFAMARLDFDDNWLVAQEIQDELWYIQYMWGFYWATTIMMTVGFGDFLPVTFREAFIVAFLELFSCIILAYNISEIGNIIGAIRSSQTEYRRKIAIFKRMSKEDQIDGDLQRRIEAFLREETTIKEKFEYNQQAQLLNEIPENLKHEYIVESNKNLFPDLPFFNNLQKTTLISFTESFQGQVYYPGEYLTKYNEPNSSIMILKSGRVGLAFKRYGSSLNGTIVQDIDIRPRRVLDEDGNYVRKVVPVLLNTDFLSRTHSINYDIVAQEYSFVFKIEESDFFQLIKASDIDSSYFFSIRHKHSIVNDEWEQIKCEYCSQRINQEEETEEQRRKRKEEKKSQKYVRRVNTITDHAQYHTKFDCPRLHYFPLKGVMVLKSIKGQGVLQNRDTSYSRKKKREKNPLDFRKKFFKPYEKARNLSFAQRPTAENMHSSKQQKNRGWFSGSRNREDLSKDEIADVENYEARERKLEAERKEQYRTLEKVVKEAIEEAMTGYRPEFWDLEIDCMHNYSNYFPLENAKNLDLVELRKGKVSSNNYNMTREDRRKRSALNAMSHNMAQLSSENRLSDSSV